MAAATLHTGLDIRFSDRVRRAISALGRTEDLRFSPSNTVLAIAGFTLDKILLLRVDIQDTPGGPRLSADDYMVLSSRGLKKPHGIDFIDENTIVVANRHGDVTVFALPPGEFAGRELRIAPIRTLRAGRFHRIKTPGSVAARHEPDGLVSILVCNNYWHVVTRHLLDPAKRYRVVQHSVFCRDGLDIPDGIALSPDDVWAAVSSHHTNDIKLYSLAGTPDQSPGGRLTGLGYAHGVRFTPDGRHVIVADAGAPVIHIYERGDSWAGERGPIRTMQVLDDETFARGRTNEEEGGPKGIDIDHTGQFLAVTCEEQELTFFRLSDLLHGS